MRGNLALRCGAWLSGRCGAFGKQCANLINVRGGDHRRRRRVLIIGRAKQKLALHRELLGLKLRILTQKAVNFLLVCRNVELRFARFLVAWGFSHKGVCWFFGVRPPNQREGEDGEHTEE